MDARTLLFVLAIMTLASMARAGVPIEIRYGVGRNRVAMKLWQDAEDKLKKGNVEQAKKSVDAALASDPTLWPAYYTRAGTFLALGKCQLAINDCNEALRQYAGFIEAELLRASAQGCLGNYGEALKDINHCIAIHPRSDALARAYNDRAWLRATCPNQTFRDGRQAIKDAMSACKLLGWQDEDAIDTLAAAYAEAGDFDSAVRYAQQALGVKGITPLRSRSIQRHLALFQQHKPLRS
jgi:tetratricopeptide (TPR) repeat protein